MAETTTGTWYGHRSAMDAVAAEVKRYTYKPNTELKVRAEASMEWDDVAIFIDLHVQVIDVHAPESKLMLPLIMAGNGTSWRVFQDRGIEYMVRQLVDDVTERWEQHERAEWLRIDGQPIHAEKLQREHPALPPLINMLKWPPGP